MPFGGLLSAGGSLLGGIFGEAGASGDRRAAQDAYNRAQAALDAIAAAPDESKPLLLQKYRSEGTLTPQLEQAIQQGPSAAAAVTTDPALMKAQMGALQSLQQQATGGMTPQARAALNQTRREAETEATGRQQALMQQMQARGLGGSGAELAAALQGGQSSASRAAEESDRLMAQNAAQAQQAALSSGQLGGQMQGQQFNQAMQKAQAQDQLNRFNVQAQQAAQAANVGAQNQAQAANLANSQDIGNANVRTANNELQRQAQAAQQKFQSDLQLAQAKAGAANTYGNQMNANANRTAQSGANIGAGIGGMLGSNAFTGLFKSSPTQSSYGPSTGTQAGYGVNTTRMNPNAAVGDYQALSHGGPVQDFRHGGPVPGQAQVPGDSPENDTVKAHLSPGEIVVPRTLAKTELGKTILKLIEHHNELKKNMSEGGEVKQDPSFMDKVANYFAPAPSPYDKLAQQGIRPEDLQRGVRSTGMYLGGEFNAGFANGGKVRGYQAGGQVDSQDYSDYLVNSIPISPEEQKRADDMAADMRIAQQNPQTQPQAAPIQELGVIPEGDKRIVASEHSKTQEEQQQDAEDKKLDDAAKAHRGDMGLINETIGVASHLDDDKAEAKNLDLAREMGAADREAEESTPREDLGLKPTSQQPSQAQPSSESQQEESPVSRLLSATKPQSSFAEQLRQAQEDERNAIQANQLGKAGALIGAGIAKVDPSKEAMGMFDQNIKLAGLPMEQLQQRVAMSKNDPDSEVSKASREFLSKLTGKPVSEAYSAADIEKISPMMEKYIQAQEISQAKKEVAQQKLEDSKEKEKERKEQKEKEFEERVRHSKSMEDISKGLSGIREDQLIGRQVNQLKNQLERGRTDLNQARTAIQQANNIYASVGLSKDKYSDADIDKIPEEKLNAVNVAIIPEIGIEMNKMLTSGGVAAQNTLNKLVPKNLNMSAAQFLSFISSNPEAANQSGYLRAYLKITSRVKEQREEYLKDYHKHIGAGLQTLKKRSPDDYEEIKTMYPEIEQSSVKSSSQPSSEAITIRRKSDGATKTLPADVANKYLQDPGFERVK